LVGSIFGAALSSGVLCCVEYTVGIVAIAFLQVFRVVGNSCCEYVWSVVGRERRFIEAVAAFKCSNAIGFSNPFFWEYQTTAITKGTEIRQPGQKMRCLYDVFSAICADEGDHVGTMKCCLDPTEAVASQSLERRVLAGLALAAALGYFVSVGEISDMPDLAETVMSGITSPDGVVETLEDPSATTAIEAAVAAAGAVLQYILNGEGEGKMIGSGTGAVDSGQLDTLLPEGKRILVELIETISKFFF